MSPTRRATSGKRSDKRTELRERSKCLLCAIHLEQRVSARYECVRLEAPITTRSRDGDDLVRELQRIANGAAQVFELEQVAERVQQTSPIADAARDRADRIELLARRVPAAGTDVVETDDDPDDLMRRGVVHVGQLCVRPGQVGACDAVQRRQAEQCASAGQTTGYLRRTRLNIASRQRSQKGFDY